MQHYGVGRGTTMFWCLDWDVNGLEMPALRCRPMQKVSVSGLRRKAVVVECTALRTGAEYFSDQEMKLYIAHLGHTHQNGLPVLQASRLHKLNNCGHTEKEIRRCQFNFRSETLSLNTGVSSGTSRRQKCDGRHTAWARRLINTTYR